MIRLLIIALVFATMQMSCEQSKECCVYPELADLNGTWELKKLTNGFAQIDQVGEEIGFTQRLEISAENSTFKRYTNNELELSSTLKKEVVFDQNALVLPDEEVYMFYSFELVDGVYHLRLYQESPIGAVLADGSDYYYLKR